MIIIDETVFDLAIVSMTAQADMLDKYAERTNDGVLHRELIGVYDNYEIEFAHSVSKREVYAALWQKLTEPAEWHTVVFPTALGSRAIVGYFAGTKHEILRIKNGVSYWRGLSTSFVSRERRP